MKYIFLFGLMAFMFSQQESSAQEFFVDELKGATIVLDLKRNGVSVCSGEFTINKQYQSLCGDEMRAQDRLGEIVSYEIKAVVKLPNGNVKEIRYFKPDFNEVSPNLGCYPSITRKSGGHGGVEVRCAKCGIFRGSASCFS
jgi:hypothetical protein